MVSVSTCCPAAASGPIGSATCNGIRGSGCGSPVTRSTAVARVVDDPDRDLLARRLLAKKYQGWQPGAPLSSWASSSLPVEIEIDPDA